MNIPNILTVTRVLLIPLFIFLFYQPSSVRSMLATGVFLIASVTDLLDGYVARRRSQITVLGKLMDPIADKLLISSALILLVSFQRVPPWMAIVLICRDFAVTGLRAVASSSGLLIPSEKMGKVKMVLQIIAVSLLLLSTSSSGSLHVMGLVFLGGSLIFSLLSAGQYVSLFWKKGYLKG